MYGSEASRRGQGYVRTTVKTTITTTTTAEPNLGSLPPLHHHLRLLLLSSPLSLSLSYHHHHPLPLPLLLLSVFSSSSSLASPPPPPLCPLLFLLLSSPTPIPITVLKYFFSCFHSRPRRRRCSAAPWSAEGVILEASEERLRARVHLDHVVKDGNFGVTSWECCRLNVDVGNSAAEGPCQLSRGAI